MFTLLLVIGPVLTQAEQPESFYLTIEPMVGDRSPLADAGVKGGCYIGQGKECNGLFYMNEDGSGVFVGTIINDLAPDPRFELLYSIKLTWKEGCDMFVGPASRMQLAPEGPMLSGRSSRMERGMAASMSASRL
jgi:hypothetical protein